MDPFKNLNKLRITEEQRFNYAFELYKELVSNDFAELTPSVREARHKALCNDCFEYVDEFIENYLEKHSK